MHGATMKFVIPNLHVHEPKDVCFTSCQSNDNHDYLWSWNRGLSKRVNWKWSTVHYWPTRTV